MVDASEEMAQKVFAAIELARQTGKIKKGANEVTKMVERKKAKLVAIAADATPKEIVMHIPIISKEKGVACITIPTKQELGAAAGIDVSTVAVAIVEEGDAKKDIEELNNAIAQLDK